MDHRADIYCLGVVIYEMLTGEFPLGRFPSPSQLAAVDARIDQIVLTTLEEEREMRQQSATEVKTDMHRAMAEGEIRKPLPAASSAPQGKGLGKLAFGVFLFGIIIPFVLWMISVRAAEAGFMLSALMMLLALVLGIFSFREHLGKVTAVSSIVTLLIYGVFITAMGRRSGPIQPNGEGVESQKSTVSVTPAQEALRKN